MLLLSVPLPGFTAPCNFNTVAQPANASLYDFKHVLKYYILCAYCFSIKVQCRAETISLRIENESIEDIYETLKAAHLRLPAPHVC